MAIEYTRGSFRIPEVSKPTSEIDQIASLETQLYNIRARNNAVENTFDGRGPIEELFNLQPGGFLQNLGELVNRPVEFMKAGVAAAGQGNAWEAATAAWRGETTMTGVELQQKLGWLSEREVRSMGGWEKFARNIATDIAIDPLNFIDLLPFDLLGKGWTKLTTKEKTDVTEFIINGVKTSGDDMLARAAARADEIVNTGQTFGARKTPYTREEALTIARHELGVMDATELQYYKQRTAERVAEFNRAYEGQSKEEIFGFLQGNKGPGRTLDPKTGKLRPKWYDYETYSYLEMLDEIERFARQSGQTDQLIPMLVGGSQQTFEDLGLYAKYLDANNNEFYIPLSIADTKKSAGAASTMMGSVMLDNSIEGIIQFADGSRLSQTSKLSIQKAFEGVNLSDGTPVAQVIDDILAGQWKARGINFSTTGTLNADDLEKVNEAMKFVIREKFDYMKIMAKDGTENFVAVDDILDHVKVSVKLGIKSKQQPRLTVNITMDHAHGIKNAAGGYDVMFEPAWDRFIGDAVGKLPYQVQDVRTIRIGILESVAEGNSILATPAKIAVNLRKGLFRKLSWKAGLSQEVARELYRIDGQGRQLIYRKNQRLDALGAAARAQSPIADDAISEFIELGARYVVDDVTGVTRIEMPESVLPIQKVLDKSVPFLKAGEAYPIPIYNNVTAKNVLDTINDAYFRAFQVEDAFQFIKRGDYYYIQLDKLSFDEFSKFQQSNTLGEVTVNIGRKQFTREMEEYLLRPEAQELVSEYSRLTSELFDTFDRQLGPQNFPDFFNGTAGYVRHRFSQEALDYVRANKPLAMSPYTKQGVDLLKSRDYIGVKSDVNGALRAYYNLDYNIFDPGINSSMQDLLQVAVTRQKSSEVLQSLLAGADDAGRPLFKVVDNVARADLGPDYTYITDFRAEFGNMYKNLDSETARVLDDYLVSRGFDPKGNKAIAMHKTAYNYMKQMNNSYRELPEFLKQYDKFMNKWKSITLFRPSFHIGNFFGNTTNMYLAGMGVVDQAKYMPRSVVWLNQYDSYLTKIDDIMRLNPGLQFDDALKQLPVAEAKAMRRLTNYFNDGVSMKMVGVNDLQGIKKSLETGNNTRLSRRILEANFKFAENMDDVQRFALYNYFMDKETARLGRLGNLADDVIELKARNYATQEVMNTLYDYSNYTDFERNVLKRLIPFYTFMKNNLIFQMKNIVRKPKMYNRLFNAYEYYISDVVGITEQDMPEYARDNMWLPLPVTVTKNDQQVISFLRTNLPISDFAEFIDDPFKRGVSSIAFPIKIPIELGFNRNVFTGQEIKEFAGEQSRLDPETGVLPGLRNEQGTLALSGDPVIQRISSELGFRVPLQYISTALDVADSAAGYQSYPDAFFDALENLGVTSMVAVEDARISNLYDLLEEERDKRYRWEQQNRSKLPTKRELGLP